MLKCPSLTSTSLCIFYVDCIRTPLVFTLFH
ncbi:hypothetical protein LINPERPRIM_LOCUS23732 [Linum perenne]